jgi:hypothetical protein
VREYLEQLRPSVGLECSPRVLVESQRIARPSCPADLDHDPGNLVTAGDLPKPAARVAACGRVLAEVRAYLPAHPAETTRKLLTRPGQAREGIGAMDDAGPD